MGLFDIMGIHIHLEGLTIIFNSGGKDYPLAAQRLGLAVLGIPIMLYALPPQNNLLLFIIGLGVWWLGCLFGGTGKKA